MCGPDVIETVTARMRTRREALQVVGRGLAGGVAGGVGLAAAGGSAAAQTPGPAGGALVPDWRRARVVDLTHTLDEAFPTYSGRRQFFRREIFRYERNGLNSFELRVDEHTGTHIDAPLHFSEAGPSVDVIAPERLIAPLVVIDIAARAAADPDATVTPDDIRAWTRVHGPVPDGACVAMHSGWAARLGGPGFENYDASGRRRHPGFHGETAFMLIEETGAASLGVDTLSLDPGRSRAYETHVAWLPSGRFGIENLARLDAVPASGAVAVIGAPKHRGGSGGPARVLALIA